jgi:hypothetical protein
MKKPGFSELLTANADFELLFVHLWFWNGWSRKRRLGFALNRGSPLPWFHN